MEDGRRGDECIPKISAFTNKVQHLPKSSDENVDGDLFVMLNDGQYEL
jgi:hypothetical protein